MNPHCWCGNEVDEDGKHLTLNEGSLHGAYFKRDGEKVQHLKDKPGRKPPGQ
jgi:hypothetical protein